MSTGHNDHGYSFVEILIVLLMTVTMAAIAIPTTSALFGNLRLSGDARGISNHIALAKMRAAADFTRARLYVDIAGRQWRVERFDKTIPGWTAEAGWTRLSYRVNFSTGGLGAPPPNTQPAIGQAPACLDNAGAAVANTACVVFNSRGIPIDNTPAASPTASDAVYVTDGSAVYSITVGATGLIRTWKSNPSVASWTKQ